MRTNNTASNSPTASTSSTVNKEVSAETETLEANTRNESNQVNELQNSDNLITKTASHQVSTPKKKAATDKHNLVTPNNPYKKIKTNEKDEDFFTPSEFDQRQAKKEYHQQIKEQERHFSLYHRFSSMTEDERKNELNNFHLKADRDTAQGVLDRLSREENVKQYHKIIASKSCSEQEREEKLDDYYGLNKFNIEEIDSPYVTLPAPKRLFPVFDEKTKH